MAKYVSNRGDGTRDLETKLAIVLAENEKLNQVVDELSRLCQDKLDPADQERIPEIMKQAQQAIGKPVGASAQKGMPDP